MTLPVEGATGDQPQPWLLHSVHMGALNFCSFATCPADSSNSEGGLLLASPNGLDTGGIDLFQLPEEQRVSQIHAQEADKTGMVMALALFRRHNDQMSVIAGYEDGRVMVHDAKVPLTPDTVWRTVFQHKPHTQPILSLSLSSHHDYFITSSADANLAKFAIPPSLATTGDSGKPLKLINTKHAGQQSLSIRSDNKIFATAGWDSRVRVYSAKTMKELAVLKWHKDGCSSTTFVEIEIEGSRQQQSGVDTTTALKMQSITLEKIREERSLKAQKMHWLAAGGKDGKISLWDIY
jgi:ASTRA-associated protein 1